MKGIQIERNFTQFVVFAEDSILSALSKITANQSRLIFVVSEAGILQGVLTDGDFRLILIILQQLLLQPHMLQQ